MAAAAVYAAAPRVLVPSQAVAVAAAGEWNCCEPPAGMHCLVPLRYVAAAGRLAERGAYGPNAGAKGRL